MAILRLLSSVLTSCFLALSLGTGSAADTTTVVPQRTTTAYVEKCADFVDGEISCSGIELQGFCTQEPAYAELICAKTCGFCQPCQDSVDSETSCASLSFMGFCQDQPLYASVICPKTCGLCGQIHGVDAIPTATAQPATATTTPKPATTTMTRASTTPPPTTTTPPPTTTTPPPPPTTTTTAANTCRDNTGAGLPCDQLVGVCETAFAQTLCPKFCNFCSA